jgi:subtilisin-like proprotein convertase family protein
MARESWSLEYDDQIITPAGVTNVAVPASGTAGVAAHYPINFDLSGARADARVNFVACAITLNHANADDLRIVLQSPAGTAVALMMSAGGTNPLAANTTLTFSDFAFFVAPDNAQMATGAYKPGGVYGQTTMPVPAPAGPYQTTFATINGEAVAGVWRLWLYDDKFSDVGTINSVTLYVGTHGAPSVTPISPANATVTEPFVRVQGTINDAIAGPATAYSVTWRMTNAANEYYASGAFAFLGGTSTFRADVPVRRGANHLLVRVTDPHHNSAIQSTALNVNEFTYALAEGATGGFFDTDVTIGNVTGDAVSTVVHSTNAVPLAVERTMSWDARGYSAWTRAAASASRDARSRSQAARASLDSASACVSRRSISFNREGRCSCMAAD